MQQHTEFGHRILSGTNSELLELAATIALTHHEKWDGSGYPGGLAGEEIPLYGRITAVADVFDALSSDRVYRRAYDIPAAVRIMKEMSEAHFDPKLFSLFLDHFPEVLDVKEEEDSRARLHVGA